MRPPGSPRRGVPGRLHREAAGERPPRARPQRRGSPGPIPNPAVKPAFAESTAARGCGRAGRRARGGRFSTCAPFERRRRRAACAACAERGPQGDRSCGPLRVLSSIVRWVAANDAAGRRPCRRSRRRATGETRPARGFVSRVLFGIEASFRSACCHGTFSSAVLLRIVSRFRWSFPFLVLLVIVLMGLIRHTNCLASQSCFDVALLR